MIQAPKGTRDFFPEDERIQLYIFAKWRDCCTAFGYEPYEGPMFEHLELYTDKSGDEIVDQLYAFEDKGGRRIALRPEMTPTLARMVALKGRQLQKPVRWFSMPRLFRYERAQKGRLREFYQLNMDILGTDSLDAEIDLMLAIVQLMESFGLDKSDFRMGVSNRRLLKAILDQLEIADHSPIYTAFDRRAKIGEEPFKILLSEAGLSSDAQEFLEQVISSKTLNQLRPYCQSDAAVDAWGELQTVLGKMEALGYGETVQLDLGIVRGLAYYTGIVFELFDSAKSMRAIAGGGRYDDLCAKLGGEKVTGVGFGMGDVVLRNLLEEKGLLPDQTRDRLDYWIVSFEEELLPVFELATALRRKGMRVGHTLDAKKMGKQLQEADRSGAQKVIFWGSSRVKPGEVEVKNLLDGSQSTQKIDTL